MIRVETKLNPELLHQLEEIMKYYQFGSRTETLRYLIIKEFRSLNDGETL